MSLPKPDLPQHEPATAHALAQHDTGAGGGLPEFLGIRTAETGSGHLACELAVRDELLNPFGTLHGGVISALTDHALGAVLYTVMEPGSWAATTEFKLNLIAPVRAGILHAEADIIAMTKRTAVVRVDITNDGRAVGAAQGTVSIKPAPAAPAVNGQSGS